MATPLPGNLTSEWTEHIIHCIHNHNDIGDSDDNVEDEECDSNAWKQQRQIIT